VLNGGQDLQDPQFDANFQRFADPDGVLRTDDLMKMNQDGAVALRTNRLP
jgi:hypothetical protein